MSTKGRLLSLSTVAVTLLVGGSALAALTSAEQKCIDGYNNKLRLVSQQAGKDYRSCIKNAGKGTPGAEGCVTGDTPGKIAGKEAKVSDLYTSGKCLGNEPIQQGSTTGNNAHQGGVEKLVHDTFGDPILDATVVSPGKDEAKCQDKATQRPAQAFTEIIKAQRSCKKNAMKAGTVTSSASLTTTCGTLAQIDTAGKAQAKITKAHDDIQAACLGLAIPTLFPGDCSASADSNALGTCIANRAKCRACETLNRADGASMNCDLFDDGLANSSCGIIQHTCVLTPSPASQIQIHIAALPVPLTFGLSGTLSIGAEDDQATCDIVTLAPVTIPAIGVVCISPSAGCATGTRWCGPGPGPALGIDVQSDGNAGACTSNTACEAAAPAACAAFGAGYAVSTAQCTGYCSGTTPANQACTSDAACLPSNGACNGPDPIGANGNICQVACINTAAHGPSVAGTIQCNLGSNLVVESAAPCNGTDITIQVGQTCIPVSTEEASSKITDANFMPGSVVPPMPNVNDILGNSVACATVDSSTVTGLRGAGAVNFFGSALGDLAVGLKSTCN